MPFTAQQTRLAMTINTHVTQVLAEGGGDEALLLSRVLPASQLDIPDVVRWTRLSSQTRIRLRRCQLKGCIPH
jgi:hypothetical protein